MKSLIVLDCDGVLRSASWLGIFEAYRATCLYLGIDYNPFFTDVDEFKSWFDSDWKNNLSRLGIEDEDDIPVINHIFHQVYDPYIRTFPWVERIVRELCVDNTLAVLSSSLSTSVMKSLSGVSGHISMVVGCEHVTRIKPHPEGLEMIMRRFRIDAKETWMIGDSDADISAGKNADTWTAAVNWGLTETPDELISLGADLILEDPNDLLFL